MSRTARRSLFVVSLLPLLCACSNSTGWSGNVPAPSPAVFQSSVYPLLLRDCAFSGCHGAEHRFFQVFGPGRTRLDPKTPSHDPATPAELQRSYDRASAMLATGDTVDDSLLLRKPLETSAGGQGHKGVDNFGRNVYQSKQDPRYAALVLWAHSAINAPAQSAAGSGGGALPAAGTTGGGAP